MRTSSRVYSPLRASIVRAAEGQFVRLELTFQLGRPWPITIDQAFAPLRDASGSVVAILGSGVDVSKRERTRTGLMQAHRDLLMLSASNQSLVRIGDETQLLSSTCQTIVEVGRYPLAWVGFAEQNESQSIRVVAAAGAGADLLRAIDVRWDTATMGCGPAGRAIRERQPCVCTSIRNDSAFLPW